MRSSLATLIVSLVALGYAGGAAAAGPFSLSYMGRMADATDKAVAGPVDIEIKFFRKQSGGNPIGVSPLTFGGVQLIDGVFQVDLGSKLTEEELHEVFATGGATWVEVKDLTRGVTHPRQSMTAVPFALKVPVDGKTIGYTAKGELTIPTPAQPAPGQVLTAGTDGRVSWETPIPPPAALELDNKTLAMSSGKLTLSAAPQDGKFLSAAAGALSWVALPGGGDMAAATFDNLTNGSTPGVVDNAENLGGQAPAYYLAAANITGAGTLPDAALSANVTKLGSSIDLSGAEVTGTLPDAALSATVTKLGSSIDLASEITGTLPDGSLSANVTKLGTDISLATSETSGVLPVSKGGTGVGTITGLLKGNATGAFTAAALADIPVGYRLNASDGAPLDALLVDAEGRVGIGTTTPTQKIHINGPLASRQGIRFTNTSTGSTDTDGTYVGLKESQAGEFIIQSSELGESINLLTSDIYRMTIKGTGNVGIGTTNPQSLLHVHGGGLQLSADSNANELQIKSASSTPSAGPLFKMSRSGGTVAVPGAVANGDLLGIMDFQGHNGSTYGSGAEIKAFATEAWGAGRGAGLKILATPNGAASPVEKMKVDGGGVSIGGGTVMKKMLAGKAIAGNTTSGGITFSPAFDTSNLIVTLTYAGGSAGCVPRISSAPAAGSVSWSSSSACAGDIHWIAIEYAP